MADLPLQSILAEYKIKDLATKDLLALQKVVNKSVKDLTALEREAARAESVLGKLGKTAKGTAAGAAGAAGTVAQKPIGIAESTISGGMVGAIAAIPVLGGLMSALAGSVGTVAEKFTSGVLLQKSLNKDFSTFNRAFGKTGKDLLNGLDSTFATITEQKQTFAKLSGAGVEAGTLKAGGADLELLAKAQGVDLKDILSTRLETGKGLSKAEISLIEAYKPLLGNIYTSDDAFKVITNTIHNAKDALKDAAKENINLTSKVQETSVNVAQSQQELALMAVSEKNFGKSLDAFSLEVDKQRINFEELTMRAAEGTVSLVKGAKNIVGGYRSLGETDTRTPEQKKADAARKSEEIRRELSGKKALGGSVNRGHTYQINEKGQEYFTPGQSGKIHPANQNNNQSVTLAPVINIYGGDSGEIRRVVNEELNNLARKIAYNQGLKIPG